MVSAILRHTCPDKIQNANVEIRKIQNGNINNMGMDCKNALFRYISKQLPCINNCTFLHVFDHYKNTNLDMQNTGAIPFQIMRFHSDMRVLRFVYLYPDVRLYFPHYAVSCGYALT